MPVFHRSRPGTDSRRILLSPAQQVRRAPCSTSSSRPRISGVIVARCRRSPGAIRGAGGLLASLPLVSVLGMIWLWRDTHDPVRMAAHAEATFWYVLPSLPMFLLIPFMLRSGLDFWTALLAGCLLTMALYAAMIALGPEARPPALRRAAELRFPVLASPAPNRSASSAPGRRPARPAARPRTPRHRPPGSSFRSR